MTFYSSSITTRLIDPIFNQANTRCEFRLNPDTVYLSNMRLMNVGVTDAFLGTAKYNILVGAYGCLKAIRLLDGNQVLDSINDVNRWLAFKNYSKTNTLCSNLNNTLSKNGLGFVYDLPTCYNVTAEDLLDQNSEFSKIVPFKESGDIVHLEENTDKSWLSLRDLFPMLGSVVNVNTSVFKNLRLVLEFSKDYTDFAVDLNEAEELTHKFTTIQPLLCVDELTADTPIKKQIMEKFDPISFSTIEQDRVRVNAIEGNELQLNTYQVQGFNNKKVGRVLIQKVRGKTSVNTSALIHNMGSPSMLNENHQFRINGSNLYPFNGITQPNEALSLVSDIWGTCDQPLGNAPFLGTYDLFTSEEPTPVIDYHYPAARDLLGETSYIAGDLNGQRIKEFQLTYGRTGIVDESKRYNEALTLLIYGEVERVILPSKSGGYVISYL